MSWLQGNWNNPRPSNSDKAPPPATGDPEDNLFTDGYPDYPTAGTVFPYRGQETHGVRPTENAWQRGADEVVLADRAVEFDSEPVPPIPVVIVNQYGRETKSWSATQMVAGLRPREIVGRNTSRTKVTVKNLHATAVVYIGRANGADFLSGFPVDPGVSIELATTDEIHAISATGNDVLVAILQEFVVRSDTD